LREEHADFAIGILPAPASRRRPPSEAPRQRRVIHDLAEVRRADLSRPPDENDFDRIFLPHADRVERRENAASVPSVSPPATHEHFAEARLLDDRSIEGAATTTRRIAWLPVVHEVDPKCARSGVQRGEHPGWPSVSMRFAVWNPASRPSA